MSEPFQSIAPASGEILWEGVPGDVAALTEQAERDWAGWAALPVTYRIEAMRRFANALRAAEARFTALIARETGKPLREARQEVESVLERVDRASGAHAERTGQRRLEGALGARTALRHKPHGVVAVLGPYVMPAAIPVGQIVPALIAGNSVLFKPSEKTPAVGEALVALFHEAGVPQSALACVQGDWQTGRALVAQDAVRAVLFTGSAHSGLSIARSHAGRPEKLLALEMGGNNPVIAWDTPDIAASAALVAQSAFAFGGQHCLCARRLIIRDTLRDMMVEELRKLAERLVIDAPDADPAPFMGPMIDMEAADGLTESFLFLMSHGGKPIKHMQRPREGLPFVTPAIIDVTGMAERPDVELFGPLLQIVAVETFEQAIAEANNSRYGLAAALIGGSPEQYDRFWSNARAGIVNWNRPTHALAPNAPLGGIGLSGSHRPAGAYMADACAYPVASAEVEQPRATIGIGLKPLEVVADR